MDPPNIQLVAFLRDNLGSDEEPISKLSALKIVRQVLHQNGRGLSGVSKKSFHCKLKKSTQARSHVRRNSVTFASKHSEARQIEEDMKKEFKRKTKMVGLYAYTVLEVS